MFGAIAAKALSGGLADPDLWWHLKTGQLIVARHALPGGDPFSITHAGRPWVVQEWGSEVILRAINALAGLRGIVIWRAGMLLLIYALVARMIRRDAGVGIGTWALIGLTAFAGVTSWTERPNLFSFLLFVITLMLVRARSASIWWFVPLAALWANLHGMVLLGLGLVALLAVIEWVKVGLGSDGADRTWALRLGAVSAAALAASLLNPYGPGLLIHAFRLVRVVSPVVTEWASPDFHDPSNLLFLSLIVMTVAGLALSPQPADLADVALVAAFTVLGLFAVRNLPVSSIVLGTVAARALPPTLAHLRAGRARAPARAVHGSGAINLVTVLLVAGIFGALIVARFPGSDPVAGSLPLRTIRELRAPGVRLFARDGWAGLALYDRWPSVHVFIDTRVDFYGSAAVRTYRRTIGGFDGWQRTLREACVTHVLIDRADALAERISTDPDWITTGDEALEGGEHALLFARRAPAPGCA